MIGKLSEKALRKLHEELKRRLEAELPKNDVVVSWTTECMVRVRMTYATAEDIESCPICINFPRIRDVRGLKGAQLFVFGVLLQHISTISRIVADGSGRRLKIRTVFLHDEASSFHLTGFLLEDEP